MTPLFAESSELVQIVTVIVTFAGTCFTGIMAYLVVKLNKKADEAAVKVASAAVKTDEVVRKADVAAVKVEEVKATLEESNHVTGAKLDGIAAVGNATHILVNSQFSAQLKVAAVALRRVADMTKHHDDVNAAELAEKLLHEHEMKQRVVDGGQGAVID